MRITYDSDADAAYIYLVDEIGAGGVDRTVPVEAIATHAMVNLDFDASGKLIGIEVLDASNLLPDDLLRGTG